MKWRANFYQKIRIIPPVSAFFGGPAVVNPIETADVSVAAAAFSTLSGFCYDLSETSQSSPILAGSKPTVELEGILSHRLRPCRIVPRRTS